MSNYVQELKQKVFDARNSIEESIEVLEQSLHRIKDARLEIDFSKPIYGVIAIELNVAEQEIQRTINKLKSINL